MALPHSILKQLWEAGYGGKVIRVPAMNERVIIKLNADELLREVEEFYELKGMSFVFERRGRSDFYRFFGLLRLCRRLHLSMEEARKARRRAYSRWCHWMRNLEGTKLGLADKFGENGEGRRIYLDIRKRVREGRGVEGGTPTELVEMARNSVGSVTWR